MGSLMAGWDSRVQDPNVEKLRRNNSLTREEIQLFWKSKKQKEEEHLRDISVLSPRSKENALEDVEGRRNERSTSLPLLDTKEEDLDMKLETEPSLEKLIQKNGWWVSSTSAFLNEPPVIASEGPRYKYASQYHVANMASSKTNNASTPTGVGA
ncbi:hypothetical protein ACH5RR_027380 [Cinchona calisaya]|uniref:Uncharacterized protein n=1 Tax=Cinchona calisaya TaxID=153742 RepID=A0ABD2Z5A1_9GENT